MLYVCEVLLGSVDHRQMAEWYHKDYFASLEEPSGLGLVDTPTTATKTEESPAACQRMDSPSFALSQSAE